MSKYFSKYGKWALLLLSIIIIVIIVVFCLFINQFFLGNCVWDCAPKRSFTELDINLPARLFPKGAKVNDLHYLRDDTAIDPAISVNFWGNGKSVYRILKSKSNFQAIENYDFNINSKLFTGSLDDIRKYSDLIGYTSQVANDSKVKCGYDINRISCIFIARYEEFTISFMSSISDKGMTDQKFLDIVRYIDDRMKTLLKKNSN